MFRYFSSKTTIIIIISALFLMVEAFGSICETDFIRALMYRASFKGVENPLIEQFINSRNIYALYKLGDVNLSLLIVGVLILGVCFGVLGIWLSSKAISFFVSDMRNAIYKQIQKLSYADIDNFSSASLVTRITTDVDITNQAVSFSSKFVFSGLFSIVFGIVKSWIDYPGWVFIYLIIIPLIFIFIAIIVGFAGPNMKKGQKDIDGINTQVRETILGIRVVKAYNLEESQKNKFETPNESLAKSWQKAYTLINIIMPVLQCIITGTIVFIYFIAWSNYESFEAAGQIIGFVNIMMQVLFGFVIILAAITQISRAIPCIKRINEVTSFEPTLKFKNDSTNTIEKGEIEFINVSHSFFNDDAHSVLKNVSIKIKPKEKIGIIGGTGSGKSTFVNLICRLFDASKGQIKIDGVDVKEFSFNEINSKVAIAMQTATLFSGTIKSNIAFGLPDNLDENELDKKIVEAAKVAEAWEFISKKDDGINSIVEQRGKNFSGGQKQRISIARTVAKKSKIIIFDDSTSALDTITERKVQTNIKKYNNATTIIVAQRISSVEELDKIIVMNNGEIVGFDSHWKLLANNDTYRSIAASQLGTEELNEMLKERGLKQIEKTTEFKYKKNI